MTISMTNGFVSKAAKTITVTLRIEQDQATLTKPTQVTMTESDIKSYGDLGFSTEFMTPYHVLAKYLITEKKATEETLKNYLLLSSGFLNGISVDGNIQSNSGSASTDSTVKDAYWMFAINDSSPVNPATGFGYSLNEYPVQDNDEITLFGVWGGDYTNAVSPFYTTFDKKEYQTTPNTNVDITLLGYDIFNDYNVKANRSINNAHILVYDQKGKKVNTTDYVTDKDGKASLVFKDEGTYAISAYRKTADGTHYDISRPYAKITVNKVQTPIVTTDTKTDKTIQPLTLTKVKKVKAVVKKTKKAKRKIVLSWKKVKNAKGYQIYLSKKKNKGYKKVVTVKKTKTTLKKKKGTYYVKIRAFSKTDSKKERITGSFSKVKKIKVK